MRNASRGRPSASLVVSIVALVIAMSGTAIAGSNILNGDSLISRGSLSGNRLRNHTLTGSQINLKRLGTVPSAKNATNATNARSATNAINATNATDALIATNALNATNATQLGGQPAASYLTTTSRVGTNGIITASGTASGTTVTLFKQGPFTVTMTCTTSAGGTALAVNATSTEANSILNGASPVPTANTTTNAITPVPPSPGPAVSHNTLDFEAPSGAHVVVSGAAGVNWPVTDECFANFSGIA